MSASPTIHDLPHGAAGRGCASTKQAPPARQVRPTAGHVLVVGLGETGLSCIRHLAGFGGRMIAVDSREHPPRRAAVESEFPDVEIRCGRFDASLFGAAAEIVVSPGVSVREPALRVAAARGVPIAGDVELFARAADAPIVAVTGSNGRAPSHRSSRRWRGARECGSGPGGTWVRPRCRCSDGAASCTCWSSPASSSRPPARCARPRRRCSTSAPTTWTVTRVSTTTSRRSAACWPAAR